MVMLLKSINTVWCSLKCVSIDIKLTTEMYRMEQVTILQSLACCVETLTVWVGGWVERGWGSGQMQVGGSTECQGK